MYLKTWLAVVSHLNHNCVIFLRLSSTKYLSDIMLVFIQTAVCHMELLSVVASLSPIVNELRSQWENRDVSIVSVAWCSTTLSPSVRLLLHHCPAQRLLIRLRSKYNACFETRPRPQWTGLSGPRVNNTMLFRGNAQIPIYKYIIRKDRNASKILMVKNFLCMMF